MIDPLTLFIIILLLMWVGGTVVYPVGSLIHLLLIVIIFVFVFRIAKGEKL